MVDRVVVTVNPIFHAHSLDQWPLTQVRNPVTIVALPPLLTPASRGARLPPLQLQMPLPRTPASRRGGAHRLLLPRLVMAMLLLAPAPTASDAAQVMQTYIPPQQASPAVAAAEREALQAFARAMGNHPVFFKYGGAWVNATLPCLHGWKWITCDFSGRVNGIDVNNPAMTALNPAYGSGGSSHGGLKGQIPWGQMTALQHLVYINVQGNELSGPVLPPAVSHFSNLEEIMFQGNLFTGPMDDAVSSLKSLQKLDVSSNRITGSLPRGISSLTRLTWLAVSQNQLSGALPPGLGNLTQIQKLDIGDNGFRGPIPESWGNLHQLELLNLQKMSLNDSLPDAWASMASLKHLVAHSAGIRSRFPAFLLKLRNISDILMSSNEMWGPLPPTADLFAQKSLTSLDLSSNYLTGSVPQLPAGRSIEFKFFTNCFNASVGAVLMDENPRSTTDCTQFYFTLDQGRPPTPALPSSSPAALPTSNTSVANSPSPPTSPSPSPSPTPSTMPTASPPTSLSRPSSSLCPLSFPTIASCLLVLLAAAMV
ncbi:unnamed protein product [Closterium sp. Yama58-4]|nr:unnamed protein product [Closterium sp. Yama58-4]